MQEVLGLVSVVGEFQPAAREAIDGLKKYKHGWREVRGFVISDMINSRAEVFQGLVEKGFTREEALVLTIDAVAGLKQAFKSATAKK